MGEPNTVKVSKKYQIAVPASVRQQLNIQNGDLLLVDIQDGFIILMPEPTNYTQALQGLHKDVWEGVDTQKYIDKERESWPDILKD